MEDASNWTERSALWIFFSLFSPNFGFCACSPPEKSPRYLSIALTVLEHMYTEIWLFEPSVIKDNGIKNTWKETLLSSIRRLGFCMRPLYGVDILTGPSGSRLKAKSGPCMLALVLPILEGWKAEWTLAGKKVTQIFNRRLGRQRS